MSGAQKGFFGTRRQGASSWGELVHCNVTSRRTGNRKNESAKQLKHKCQAAQRPVVLYGLLFREPLLGSLVDLPAVGNYQHQHDNPVIDDFRNEAVVSHPELPVDRSAAPAGRPPGKCQNTPVAQEELRSSRAPPRRPGIKNPTGTARSALTKKNCYNMTQIENISQEGLYE